MKYDHNTHQIIRGMRTTRGYVNVDKNVAEPDARPHIMTKDGWKPLTVFSEAPRQVMENPFRSHDKAGYASFEDWLRAG